MRFVPQTACILIHRLGQPGCGHLSGHLFHTSGAAQLRRGTVGSLLSSSAAASRFLPLTSGVMFSNLPSQSQRHDDLRRMISTQLSAQSMPLSLPMSSPRTTSLSMSIAKDDANHLESTDKNGSGQKHHIHVIILVHGWLGNDKEMGYIEESLKGLVPSIQQDVTNLNTKTKATAQHRFVIHSAKCNVGCTTDGIEAGGLRLAKEIDDVVSEIVAHEQQQRQQQNDQGNGCVPSISVSLIGNSLGGLYARYAVGHAVCLVSSHENESSHNTAHAANVTPAIFCTTATPHLGVSRNTWIPIPRMLETFIGTMLQRTGRDLFCLSDVVQDLCTQSQYTRPLRQFRHRIAHANAFHTDFQVPTPTAAFLTRDGMSLQRRVDPARDMPPEHVVTVTTGHDAEGGKQSNDAMAHWARALDDLGWQKVFWDVRPHLPFGGDRRDSLLQSSSPQEMTSSQLLEMVTESSMLPTLPFGHTVLVANSKNEWYREWNRGGRPIMDHVAQTMMRELLSTSNEN